MEDALKSDLYRFLKGYGLPETMQSLDAAAYDSQIKNISVPLSELLSNNPHGTVVDVGSGNGVLLSRLASMKPFISSPDWMYLAIDFEEHLNGLIKSSVDLGIHRRVEGLSLDNFNVPEQYEHLKVLPRPFVVVCRNVFHELSIHQTATLLFNIATATNPDESLFLQDLQKFPSAERGNACWQPLFLQRVIEKSGFSSSFVEEPSSRGNQWFTFLAKRKKEKEFSFESILQSVILSRNDQYLFWKEQKEILPGDLEIRDTIGMVDFDLQISALHKQLAEAQAPGIATLTPAEQENIVVTSLKQQLARFDSSVPIDPDPTPKFDGFRDRARSQDALQDFLLSNGQLTVIRGGPFMGKSVLVQEVLHRRAHDRRSIFFDVSVSSTIWNLVEQYLTEVDCKISYDLIKRFSDIEYKHIRSLVAGLVADMAAKTIIVFDHFERLLNPNGALQDNEIQDFLADLASTPTSKVIITTRTDPDLNFLPDSVAIDENQPLVGRFPEGPHVRNVLDDYIDRAKYEIAEYPESLIGAIDRVPYLAAIAGRAIQSDSLHSFDDEEFLDLIRSRLREELIRRIITENSKQAIEVIGLLRSPVPREVLVELSSSSSVHEAEELGLVYPVHDHSRTDLVSGIGVLHSRATDDEFEGIDPENAKEDSVDTLHKRIAESLKRLYRKDNDPRWIRECYFHTLAAGDANDIEDFGTVYRGELFWAGNYWFNKHRNHSAALAAFKAANNLGLESYELELRIAACLFRVGEVEQGEQHYSALIDRFPDARGVKTSLVDSYLALSRYDDALQRLEQFELEVNTSAWVAHQYGRTYLGLHKNPEAIVAFEAELRKKPRAITYMDLATAYRRIGKREEVGLVLEKARNRYPKHFRILVSYASHLVQLGGSYNMKKAEVILRDLLERSPGSGRVLQQLCKLLRIQHRAPEAREILERQKSYIFPDRYRSSIYVEVLMAEQRWESAVHELANISSSDVHLVGQKKRVYLSWAISTEPDEAIDIAKQGLHVPMDRSLLTNAPLLVTHARLAYICENDQEFERTMDLLREINQNVADSINQWIESDVDQIWFWDDEL